MSNDKSEQTGKNRQTIQPDSMDAAIEDIRRMFVDEIQVPRIVNNNQTPAKRAAFAKTHGIAYGTFQVSDNLPQKYQLGIFTPGKSYSAWVRYSSDIAQTAPDLKSTVGIGIKLFGVPGKKTMESEADGTTLDFILQNTEVFFASDAVDMANFKAAAMSGNLGPFLEQNPELADVLNSMEKKVNSLVTEPFWSCVPFKFGDDYCKFKVDAETVPSGEAIEFDATDYLGVDLAKRLMKGDVKLNFYVQIRNNPATQSIISARSLWKEDEAIPFKVATLILYKQNIRARQQQEYGESLSFNLWRTLPEMQPVGSIAEARKVTYQSSAKVRRNVNGQSIGEPDEPRAPRLSGMPAFTPTTETPWPIGTLGNATENFMGSITRNIKPRHSEQHFELIEISARDTQADILINHKITINNTTVEYGISYINEPPDGGVLRMFFSTHMKRVSFNLLVQGFTNDTRGLSIEALRYIQFTADTLLSTASRVTMIDGRVTVEVPSGESFNLITFSYGPNINKFNFNNVVMTYA